MPRCGALSTARTPGDLRSRDRGQSRERLRVRRERPSRKGSRRPGAFDCQHFAVLPRLERLVWSHAASPVRAAVALRTEMLRSVSFCCLDAWTPCAPGRLHPCAPGPLGVRLPLHVQDLADPPQQFSRADGPGRVPPPPLDNGEARHEGGRRGRRYLTHGRPYVSGASPVPACRWSASTLADSA